MHGNTEDIVTPHSEQGHESIDAIIIPLHFRSGISGHRVLVPGNLPCCGPRLHERVSIVSPLFSYSGKGVWGQYFGRNSVSKTKDKCGCWSQGAGAADEGMWLCQPNNKLMEKFLQQMRSLRHHCGERTAKQQPAHDNPEAFFGNGPVSALSPKLQL